MYGLHSSHAVVAASQAAYVWAWESGMHSSLLAEPDPSPWAPSLILHRWGLQPLTSLPAPPIGQHTVAGGPDITKPANQAGLEMLFDFV